MQELKGLREFACFKSLNFRIQWTAGVSGALTMIGLCGLARAQSSPQPGELGHTVAAPSFTVRGKADYRIVQGLGLRGFGGALMGAAIGQARGAPSEWGGGIEGFTRRYASGFGANFSRQVFAFTLESAFHEDPRYFPSRSGTTKKGRAANALKQAIWTRKDNGGSEFAYARVFSEFGAATFTNVWQPASTGHTSSLFVRGLVGLGGDCAYDFMQEFIRFTRPSSLRNRH